MSSTRKDERMPNMRAVAGAGAGALLMLGAVAATGEDAAAAASTGVELHAALRHSSTHPHASGRSHYERKDGKREVDVTVRAAGLAGRRVTVFVNHRLVGSMRLSATGFAHRHWSTEHGQSVPVASAGNPVRVIRANSSDLVVSGRYARDA
jgi:hypothetical protein